MRFLQLKVRNFLSVGPEQVLNLAQRGLVSVFGANGDGKSCVTSEAVAWCLWGKTLRGLTADAVVNNAVGKDCSVSLTLDDNGTIYEISRGRKLKGKRANDLQIFVNGEEATQGINKDSQAEVDRIIGFSLESFQQSVLLSPSGASFCSLTDAQQKEILEDILQLSKISYAKNKALARLQIKKTELEILERERVYVQTARDSALARWQRLENEVIPQQRLKKLNDTATSAIHRGELEAKLDGLYERLLNPEIEYHFSAESIQTKLEEIDKALEVLRDRESATERAWHSAMTKDSLDYCCAIERIGHIKKQHAKLSEVGTAECPTCLQDVDQEHLFSCISGWLEELKELKAFESHYLQKQEDLKQAHAAILATLDRDKKDLLGSRAHYNSVLRGVLAATNERNRVVSDIKALEIQLNYQAEASEDVSTMFKLALEAKDEVKVKDSEIASLDAKRKVLRKEVAALEFWKTGFGNQGLKSLLLDNVLPYLTERAQYYADILSDGQYEVSFDNKKQLKNKEWKEELQVVVNNRQGGDKYEGISSGERRRIDIAISWALGDLAAHRVNKSLKFKSLDEPFENLDQAGVDAVVKLLHKVVKDYETILVVTHNDALRNLLPNEITVQKVGGFTKVVDTARD